MKTCKGCNKGLQEVAGCPKRVECDKRTLLVMASSTNYFDLIRMKNQITNNEPITGKDELWIHYLKYLQKVTDTLLKLFKEKGE